MRLSWYADTGVAVFSIWQAGMCTGTFRLPIADLSRMIEILERGPAPRGRGRAPVSAGGHGEERSSDSDWYYGRAEDEQARPGAAGSSGGYGPDPSADYGQSGYEAGYGRGRHGTAGYGGGERGPADYGTGGYGQPGPGSASDQRDADYEAGYGSTGGYGPADYGPAADEPYPPSGYGPAGQASGEDYRGHGNPAGSGRGEHAQGGGYQAGYESGSYEPGGYGTGGYGTGGYEPGGSGTGGYGAAEAEHRTGEYSGYPDQRRTGSDHGYVPGDYADRQEFRAAAGTDSTGYRDERFVAPYVGDAGQAYGNDNPAAASGYQGDIGDAAYPDDRRPVPPSDRYPEPAPAEEAYSYGADYRYR
jgi:hypothetical protein